MCSSDLILLFALENKMPFVIALIGIILLIAYENGLKAAGISGNITVGLMSGAIFLFAGMAVRSEERRVGKECRSRWSPYH